MKCPHCKDRNLLEEFDEGKKRYVLRCGKCKCLFATVIVKMNEKCQGKGLE